MKKYISLLLILALFGALFGCGGDAEPRDSAAVSAPTSSVPVGAAPEETLPGYGEEEGPLYTDGGVDDQTSAGENWLDEDGSYTTAADVALYLHLYGELPDNFITKNEARDLGWSGGGLENYAPGMCIGGDRFGNREGLLPKGNYHECDINTLGENSRGAERLVWDEDGNIYYTGDHYESFELLYEGEK